MIASISAQDQLAALIADAMPQQIMAFKFSPAIQKRIQTLVDKKKDGQISTTEKDELDKYMMYDLLIGLAKARAIQHTKSFKALLTN